MTLNFDVIKQAELTQQEFAEMVGVSRTTINLWVTGRFGPHKFLQPKVEAILHQLATAVKNGLLPCRTRANILASIQQAASQGDTECTTSAASSTTLSQQAATTASPNCQGASTTGTAT